MKKLIFMPLLLLLALALCACGNPKAADNTNAPAGDNPVNVSTDEPQEGEGSQTKTLVVYYSATGSTKAVAQIIADELGADLFELIPAEAYTAADLDWRDEASRVNREHNDESLRDVKLTANQPESWGDYDTVFVGYPIWWGIAAWPVNDFVKNNDFDGKTVIPFCTSSSSGLGESGSLLAEMAAGGDWQTGQRFASGVDAADVSAWLDGLAINE